MDTPAASVPNLGGFLTVTSALELITLIALVIIFYKPLGALLYAAMSGQVPTWLKPLKFIETALKAVAGRAANTEMTARQYLKAVLGLSLLSFLVVWAGVYFQPALPLFPGAEPLRLDTAFNLAASYITNTNWQAVTAERALHPLTQTLILGVQHFISAAVGLCAAFVLLRALKRKDTKVLGNFWQDIIRSVLYLLLPLYLVYALILGFEGVPQTLHTELSYTMVEDGKNVSAPLGLVASLEASKQLGTNGGGFYGANAGHPFANPTPLTNFLGLLAMLLVPAGLCHLVSLVCNNQRQGRILLLVKMLSLLWCIGFAVYSEALPITASPIDSTLGAYQSGGAMEGKEQRFGTLSSAVWAMLATATGTGANNASFEALHPVTTTFQLILMQVGEVIFGGSGMGIVAVLLYCLLTVFIAGLMVGRTPEFWGKKIGVAEVRLLSLYILLPPFLTLTTTAVVLGFPVYTAQLANMGSIGFTELLYGVTSVAQNNGSALGGLSADVPVYNWLFGVLMLLSRFGTLTIVFLLSEQLLSRRPAPATSGTLATDDLTFAGLLLGIIIVGVLTYLPALFLGPIAMMVGNV
ncbi:MAG: potassium-transporting ATPase subunit KdpA [Alphaproteobacteria bacterium]|nr:potassium-transporting ATPase subunit KdpA [Alphaproteobacteria bacterium]